ncbi:MAG: hypothetical protein ABJD07_13990 [Gemmatimonadaceae bacterium]
MRNCLFAAIVVAASSAATPATARTQGIDPGMNREQVMARLGPVVAERTVGSRSYLFYRNGCEIECGTHDIVILNDGVVVDAIFRASYRRFTGRSSSPVALPARGDSTPAPVAPPPKGGYVTGNSVPIPTTAPPGISAARDTLARRDSLVVPEKGMPVTEGSVKVDTLRRRPPPAVPQKSP